MALMSCESTPQTTPPDPVTGPVAPGQGYPPPSTLTVGKFTTSGHEGLDVWRDQFAARALREGHTVEIIRSVLDGIRPMAAFLERSSAVVDQAEFSKPIWDYVDDTVSQTRLVTGREKLSSSSRFVRLGLDSVFPVCELL